MIHLFLQAWYSGKNPKASLRIATKYLDAHLEEYEAYYHPEELEKIAKVKAMVTGICRAIPVVFSKKRLKIRGIEHTLQFPVRDLKGNYSVYAGTIDAIVETKEGYWVLDYKTRSSLPNQVFEWLRIDNQTRGYNWLLRKAIEAGIFRPGGKKAKKPVIGVTWSAMIMSRIRHKQTQTYDQYLEELEGIYCEDPDRYFKSISVRQDDAAIADFEEDLYQDIKEIQGTTHRGKSTGTCFNYQSSCGYLPLCLNGFTRVTKKLYVNKPPDYWLPKGGDEEAGV